MNDLYPKELKVIITGATGMVGEGVMHECLQHPRVAEILLIVRRPSGVSHPKVKEVVHDDFYDLSRIEQHLSGYDACYFCLGVSSIGLKESRYYKLTHSLTLSVAEALSRLNPSMTFCYVSGKGTDSTEKGRMMWARVKGKTENDLFMLPFRAVHAFRPGFIKPTRGLKRTQAIYKYMGWLYPIGKSVFPDSMCTLSEIGQAMINVSLRGYQNKILEVRDIVECARPGEKVAINPAHLDIQPGM